MPSAFAHGRLGNDNRGTHGWFHLGRMMDVEGALFGIRGTPSPTSTPPRAVRSR